MLMCITTDIPTKIVDFEHGQQTDAYEAFSHIEEIRKEQTENSGKEENKWQKLITIPDKYEDYRQSFIEMLTHFATLSDGHLGHISMTKCRVELKPTDIYHIHCAPYRTGPTMRQRKKDKIDKVREINVIEPVQAEWDIRVVFVRKKDGEIRFCVDCCKLNASPVRESSSFSEWTNVSTRFAAPKHFQLSTQIPNPVQ